MSDRSFQKPGESEDVLELSQVEKIVESSSPCAISTQSCCHQSLPIVTRNTSPANSEITYPKLSIFDLSEV